MNGNVEPLLSTLDRHLLDDFQHDFPLDPQPFATIADKLGVSEKTVIERLKYLKRFGALSRVGPVLRPNRIGASTLAALAVPADRLETVAAMVSALPEVNHNYEREHVYNLWFVVTAADRDAVDAVLQRIERDTGLAVLDLPMLEDYFIDLGFSLQWR
ncbi:MAG: AsnC family transcriptional regulator [Gammaproteobacteria bacterium]|nr:AsnC family transcriptional regulator [Gammaproteobacteria bacterium]